MKFKIGEETYNLKKLAIEGLIQSGIVSVVGAALALVYGLTTTGWKGILKWLTSYLTVPVWLVLLIVFATLVVILAGLLVIGRRRSIQAARQSTLAHGASSAFEVHQFIPTSPSNSEISVANLPLDSGQRSTPVEPRQSSREPEEKRIPAKVAEVMPDKFEHAGAIWQKHRQWMHLERTPLCPECGTEMTDIYSDVVWACPELHTSIPFESVKADVSPNQRAQALYDGADRAYRAHLRSLGFKVPTE